MPSHYGDFYHQSLFVINLRTASENIFPTIMDRTEGEVKK